MRPYLAAITVLIGVSLRWAGPRRRQTPRAPAQPARDSAPPGSLLDQQPTWLAANHSDVLLLNTCSDVCPTAPPGPSSSTSNLGEQFGLGYDPTTGSRDSGGGPPTLWQTFATQLIRRIDPALSPTHSHMPASTPSAWATNNQDANSRGSVTTDATGPGPPPAFAGRPQALVRAGEAPYLPRRPPRRTHAMAAKNRNASRSVSPLRVLGRRVRRAYQDEMGASEQALLVAWSAFGVTFGIARAITYWLRGGHGPSGGGIVLAGRHIHHYNLGIVLLAAVGAIALRGQEPHRRHPLTATAYGSGTALIVDELALLIDLQDVYWAREGRRSVDAAIGVIAAGGAYLAAATFWRRAAWEVAHTCADTASGRLST
ncbi:MAG: hypothetical protein ACRDU4_01115 [Mycobacterium sp.]